MVNGKRKGGAIYSRFTFNNSLKNHRLVSVNENPVFESEFEGS